MRSAASETFPCGRSHHLSPHTGDTSPPRFSRVRRPACRLPTKHEMTDTSRGGKDKRCGGGSPMRSAASETFPCGRGHHLSPHNGDPSPHPQPPVRHVFPSSGWVLSCARKHQRPNRIGHPWKPSGWILTCARRHQRSSRIGQSVGPGSLWCTWLGAEKQASTLGPAYQRRAVAHRQTGQGQRPGGRGSADFQRATSPPALVEPSPGLAEAGTTPPPLAV